MSSRKSSKRKGVAGGPSKKKSAVRKRCWSCGKRKPPDEFSRNRCNDDGRETICRECKSAAHAKKSGMRRTVRAALMIKRFADWHERRKTNNRSHRRVRNRETCAVNGCGRMGERHHVDYNNPSAVVFLCEEHHIAFHQNERLLRGVAKYLGLRIPGERRSGNPGG